MSVVVGNPPHCPPHACGRRAPVQRGDETKIGPGTVAWSEHLLAHAAYAREGGSGQSAERIAERGGFGYDELRALLGRAPETWRPAGT